MKKLLALTLTMAMLLTMTAMAEDTIKLNGETSKDVTATYKEGNDGGTIYSVDIVWGSMAFTYNAESKGVWNPGTHTYNDKAEAEWTCDPGANVVKVINHSNAELTANVSFSSTVDGVSGTFDKNELKLATAVGTDKDKAPNDSAYLTLSGELPKSEESVIVGSVTVTIDDYSSSNSDITDNLEPTITNIVAEGNIDYMSLKSSGLKLNIEGTNLNNLASEDIANYILVQVKSDDENTDITAKGLYSAISDTEAVITYTSSSFMTFNSIDELIYEII